MKTSTLFIALLAVITLKTNAQIPNGGFEEWDAFSNYLQPQHYISPNEFATGSFHPVTQSTDHYPSDIGNYSLRLENNTSLLPSIEGFGVVLQNRSSVLTDGPGPYFPITGHPMSLTGYYKYLPQGNDTMRILVLLFKNGVAIVGRAFITTDTIPDWRPFTINFPTYSSADSCSILIASYNANGLPPEFSPRGNSVLYIDNLNFDVLITSTQSQITNQDSFNLYPNPASNFIFLKTTVTNDSEKTLNIYNVIGKLVRTEKLISSQSKINIENLNAGIYMIEIKSRGLSEKKRLIIQ